MFSFWEKESFIKSPDVIIIGSGIVGLSSAISIKKKQPGLHVLIVERGMLPYGASTRNAGFACYGSASELLMDLSVNSHDEVFSLVEKRWLGLQRLRSLLGDKAISYEPFGGFELFFPHDEKTFNVCMETLPLLNIELEKISGLKNVYSIDDDKIKSSGFKNINHVIKNSGEGQIHTGKMMHSLLQLARSSGVEILNGANVLSINDDNDLSSISVSLPGSVNHSESTFTISSRRILICVNGFAKKFLHDLDVQPARSQVIVTSPIEDLAVQGSFHFDHGYYYFRNVGDRILFGGGRNSDFENEFTDEFGLTEKIQNRLEKILREEILPGKNYKIEMRWSGIMGLGREKSPIIRQTGSNIFCAVRMGGMGIAIGTLVGEEAADMILKTL